MAKRSQSRINLLLGIDKPSGMTSHDVVARVRRALGERRVGHAGTLDPMATGVMVLGVGQATRLLGLITLDTKSYIAEITFGTETDTDDVEGRVVREASARPELFDSAFASKAVTDVIGVQEQVPPAYSAISVNGVRSYKRARSGEDVGGIIRIAEMSGDISKTRGILDFLYFMALLSINLGLINLFPIPVLDGGHVVIYLLEIVSRREINAKLRDGLFKIGLGFILFLMVFATWNDIQHLITRWFD